MPEKHEKNRSLEMSLPQATSADLRGRQSVRATFRLTEGCIDAIHIVATQLGIKQKSLFDHLVEDTKLLESIAREFQRYEINNRNRIQKTYVISRRSLISLDEIAQSFDAPRDILVEFSVQRLLPIVKREQERHKKRKELLKIIDKHHKNGNDILKQVVGELGEDDPITNEFLSTMAVYQSAKKNMSAFVEKGKMIEEFDLDALETTSSS